MINKILKLILKFIFWLAGAISSVVLYPIYQLLSSLLENFPDYISSFTYFLNTQLLPIIPFVREVFLNVTNLPRPFFYALVTLFLGRLALHYVILAFKFLIKIYYIIRGSVSSSSKE